MKLYCALALTLLSAAELAAAEPATIDFNRQVRPLLSNYCFKCHGPDAAERQAELRLDERDAALKPAASELAAIVPGDPDESELVRRILSDDESDQMPPSSEAKQLTDADKQVLRQWIAEGAPYSGHWAFTAPTRTQAPGTGQGWARNPIDHFVAERLKREGLEPSPEADRTALIRRLTLDLTGLPPTLAEIDSFLADQSTVAYERVVDRLLASPHYGERQTLEWLDAARYADTHGYHIDSGRDMTRWREWVIDSFNHNKPFNEFTVEQLAGDLLPDATLEQKIASGFNRNHMINFEGGAVPEEYHTAYIIDRVNTTSTVWLGLTVGCAQCHDHKYDPISQKDYYRLYAFFNNVPENGLDGNKGNAAPLLPTPTKKQRQQLDELAKSIASVQARLESPLPEVDAAQAAWEQQALAGQTEWTVVDPAAMTSAGGATFARQSDQTILVEGPNAASETYTVTLPVPSGRVSAVRLEALPDDRFNGKGPGRSNNGNIVLTEVSLAHRTANGDQPIKIKKVTADFAQDTFPIEQAIDGKRRTGWAILPEVGKPHAAVFETGEPIDAIEGTSLVVTLDFQSQFAQHQLGRFRLSVSSSSNPHDQAGLPSDVLAALKTSANQRTDAQRGVIRNHYRGQVAPETAPLRSELASLTQGQQKLQDSLSTTMVMQEMPTPRPTFILNRGQYDKHGEPVTAGVPTQLHLFDERLPGNRLGLARWLVDPANPLTARVIVNRFWQMYFGTGLVKSSEDFGLQGELPSHPELLDWLATEFVGSGWDVKHLQRLIVTSATYRQQSIVPSELTQRDAENRLLARGPRFRLSAELIRDQALAVSGLLNPEIGGHSVSPYQPPGLWEELMSRSDGANWSAQSYTQSHGADLYRRTMYTFWKRTCPPPTLSTFDAPDREICTVRRARTNTPLQALVLMNDPTYVEASRKLAERMMTDGGSDSASRIAFAFRLSTARMPSERELSVLTRIYEEQRSAFAQDADAALKLLAVGEAPRNESLDAAELAAWSMVASVILNLDETVTKG